MKRTALYDIHRQLGAKLVEFGGFEMPLMYSSIIDEHRTVRSAVGVFDVSHMGEFGIQGKDALDLVQRVTINDASKLAAGKAQYSALCSPDGGIIDDLLVYRREDSFMLVVNAANVRKDYDWILSNRRGLHAEVADNSDSVSLLAVQGPKSVETLQSLTRIDLASVPYYSFVETQLAGVPMIVSRTGYTGELGFELYISGTSGAAEKAWKSILEAGAPHGIKPIGLGARDTLRLEMGFCLYGNDIDQTTNPLEAGLGWITKLDKGDFIGRDRLLKVKQDGLTRKLVGFTLEEQKAFPRHGYEILCNGCAAGRVTSGTVSPTLERGIGLGYVDIKYSQPNSPIKIVVREKEIMARVVEVPFISK